MPMNFSAWYAKNSARIGLVSWFAIKVRIIYAPVKTATGKNMDGLNMLMLQLTTNSETCPDG